MKYLVLDTETGGLNPQTDALMSVGAILLDENLKEVSVNYALFQNILDRDVGERAKEVNGLDESRLATGLYPVDFVSTWKMFTDYADILIGHNVAFDVGFMNANGFDVNFDKFLDTMHLSWDVWAGEKASLTKCYKRTGGNPREAHNALYDCQMVVKLLRWFVSMGHLGLPLPCYPIIEDFYEKKAFGYIRMKEMGLI